MDELRREFLGERTFSRRTFLGDIDLIDKLNAINPVYVKQKVLTEQEEKEEEESLDEFLKSIGFEKGEE